MSQSDGEKNLWAKGVVLTFDFVVDDLKKYFSETAPQGAKQMVSIRGHSSSAG